MKWSLCLKEPPCVSSVHPSGRRSRPILGVLGSWQRSCLLSFLPFYPRFIIYTREIKNSSQLVLRSSLFPIFHNPHQENEVFQECLWDHEQMLVHSLIPQLLHTRSLPWTLPLSEAVVFPSLLQGLLSWFSRQGWLVPRRLWLSRLRVDATTAPEQRIIWPKNARSAKVKKIRSSENMDQYPLISDKRVFILFRLFLQLPGLQGLWKHNLQLMLFLCKVLVAYTRIPYPSGP